MTPEEMRRLIAAQSTEMQELRSVLVKLAVDYAKICDLYCIRPLTHEAYREAMEQLR